MSKPFSSRIRRRALHWADLAIFPLVLGLSILPLLWFWRNYIVNVDASLYLLLGWNLISGEGLRDYVEVFTGRGPVFPGFLGGLMLVFGRDVESLVWAVRLLALANPLLVYFLIKRISGPAAGLLAAAMVTFFSSTATEYLAFNVDAFQLTIYLLAVLVLLIGAQKDRAALSLLSGLLLGVAIITKETSFAALPLALFTALLLKSSFRGVLLHYAGVAAVFLPWWIWGWAVSQKVPLEVPFLMELPSRLVVPVIAALTLAALLLAVVMYRLGIAAHLLADERRRRRVSWSVLLASTIVLSFLLLTASDYMSDHALTGTATYFTRAFLNTTPLWYLLPFAVIYALWETVRGNRLWGFYFALLVLQIPVSLLVLVAQLHTRQWLILQVLLYGALAGLIVKIAKALGALAQEEGYNLRRWLAFGAATVLFVVLGGVTVSQAQFLLFDVTNLRVESLPYDREDNPAVYDMHAWIAENVPEKEKITTTAHNSLYTAFLDGMQHEWIGLKADDAPGPNDLASSDCLPSEEITQGPPQPTVRFKIDENYGGLALSLATLVQQMERSGSTYLLVTQPFDGRFPNNSAWASYLDSSGAFETVHSSYLIDAPSSRQQPYGLVLLKRTGRVPAPTQIDTYTANAVVRCE